MGLLSLKGTVAANGNDTIFMTASNGNVYAVSLPDEILQLSTYWQDAEFNVFGFNNSEEAVFDIGAGVVVNITIGNGIRERSQDRDRWLYREINNFDLVKPGCSSANPTAIQFEETTVAGAVPHRCPPSPAPPASYCQGLQEGVTIAQQRLQVAQTRRGETICQGPASLECTKQVQSAQAALTAAEQAYRNECPP